MMMMHTDQAPGVLKVL